MSSPLRSEDASRENKAKTLELVEAVVTSSGWVSHRPDCVSKWVVAILGAIEHYTDNYNNDDRVRAIWAKLRTNDKLTYTDLSGKTQIATYFKPEHFCTSSAYSLGRRVDRRISSRQALNSGVLHLAGRRSSKGGLEFHPEV
ncbi:hypothetical protein JCM11491_004752 [Sporobolomyces phaffii]